MTTTYKCCGVSNFRDNYRYLTYKYKIENHTWNSSLCKLHRFFFNSYMSHNITCASEGEFLHDLYLIGDDYTGFFKTVQL